MSVTLVFVLCSTVIVSGNNVCVEEKVADGATPFTAGKIAEPKLNGKPAEIEGSCYSTGNSRCVPAEPNAVDGLEGPSAEATGLEACLSGLGEQSFAKFLVEHPKYNGWRLAGWRCGAHWVPKRDI